MIVQYASDLHLEFPENKEYLKTNPLKAKGDVLVLAGDIVPFAVMDKHKDFFSYISDHFETTYWIPGNHEYYYFDLAEKCGTLNENIKTNVHLVNNLSVELNSVRFVFSTLWSKISQVNRWQIEQRVSDFRVIQFNNFRFTSDQFNLLHEESLAFITQELHHNYTGKTVVVTHHVPTFMQYPDKYRGDILNEAFAVELYDLIETNGPDFWIFGHHHFNTPDFMIGKTNLATNQLGYVKCGEHKYFKNLTSIEV
ncbi:MAG: metallophosphoesterase [Bacteroidota bacterium]|nr:metallophosphoesterase [Bacteroidota bacterium]